MPYRCRDNAGSPRRRSARGGLVIAPHIEGFAEPVLVHCRPARPSGLAATESGQRLFGIGEIALQQELAGIAVLILGAAGGQRDGGGRRLVGRRCDRSRGLDTGGAQLAFGQCPRTPGVRHCPSPRTVTSPGDWGYRGRHRSAAIARSGCNALRILDLTQTEIHIAPPAGPCGH